MSPQFDWEDPVMCLARNSLDVVIGAYDGSMFGLHVSWTKGRDSSRLSHQSGDTSRVLAYYVLRPVRPKQDGQDPVSCLTDLSDNIQIQSFMHGYYSWNCLMPLQKCYFKCQPRFRMLYRNMDDQANDRYFATCCRSWTAKN